MSVFRRWFDPIRSRWFYQKPSRQNDFSTAEGLSIYLRLDDVYSYLAVQQLPQLNEILSDELKPLKVILSKKSVEAPNGMSAEEWLNYCLNDAKILAKQHRFGYDDEQPELPSAEALAQAEVILKNTPLRDEAFLYLLEDVFHMLWQQQYGKLRTLYVMASQQQSPQQFPERMFKDVPVAASFFEIAGRKYQAVDGLLRLTRRLRHQKLLTGNPIFLINHIEWREHLIHDAEDLADIHAMHAELDLYIALEDPFSWLLLAYIKENLANYYNVQLRVHPLAYRGRDAFDWSLATRLSKRTEVVFTPFCRPTPDAVINIARLFYSVEEDQRVDVMYSVLQAVWSKGKDLSYPAHVYALQRSLNIEKLAQSPINALLQQNDIACKSKHQPDLPVMELTVNEKSYVFSSLYRVWMIESLLNNILEQQMHVQKQDHPTS